MGHRAVGDERRVTTPAFRPSWHRGRLGLRDPGVWSVGRFPGSERGRSPGRAFLGAGDPPGDTSLVVLCSSPPCLERWPESVGNPSFRSPIPRWWCSITQIRRRSRVKKTCNYRPGSCGLGHKRSTNVTPIIIPQQSRGFYDCWPLKGACSQSERNWWKCIFPKMSNSGSPQAEAEVYLRTI